MSNQSSTSPAEHCGCRADQMHVDGLNWNLFVNRSACKYPAALERITEQEKVIAELREQISDLLLARRA